MEPTATQQRALEMYRALEYKLKPSDQMEFTERWFRTLYRSGRFFSLPVLLEVQECKQPWFIEGAALSRPTNRAIVALITRMLVSGIDPRQVVSSIGVDHPGTLARLEDDLTLHDKVIINCIQTYFLNPVFIFSEVLREHDSILMREENLML